MFQLVYFWSWFLLKIKGNACLLIPELQLDTEEDAANEATHWTMKKKTVTLLMRKSNKRKSMNLKFQAFSLILLTLCEKLSVIVDYFVLQITWKRVE